MHRFAISIELMGSLCIKWKRGIRDERGTPGIGERTTDRERSMTVVPFEPPSQHHQTEQMHYWRECMIRHTGQIEHQSFSHSLYHDRTIVTL